MKKINQLAATALLLTALSLQGCSQRNEEYYVKHIEFPAEATLEQKVDMAARLVPTPQQMEWQQMELTAFLHFGINTFTDREWGDGTEDPALFNPTELNAEQWVQSLKEAGFRMVILTAKHHDGFCLWPTKTTKHSVASSKWKDGKGDVVKELRDACTKYDMKFGVYLSPWDRNAESYGDSPRYNQFFIEQLTELLTNYGEVHEVWFDGACAEGPNGKKQVYDWDAFYKTIQTLQPKAVMAIMGDDVRWVGNERGLGRETEWSATVLAPGIYTRSDSVNTALGVGSTSKDLGSREVLAKASELFWYPSEVDVSIRPGWFYHADQDNQVKSLKHLMDIYCQSVGYNSVLLLNIPPDRRGLIHENDVKRLKEFAAYRNRTFADNLVADGQVLWTAAAGESREYTLKEGATVNLVVLQEDISKGQRVEEFEVEGLVDGQWQSLGKGTTVGYKRILRIPDTQAAQLRVKLLSTRLKANICNVAAYHAAPLVDMQDEAQWNNLPRESWKTIAQQPLTIDLGQTTLLKAFTYAPLNGEAKPTMAFKYTFSISTDGKQWTEVPTSGEFSNIMHNPVPQTVTFENSVRARFIKLEARTTDGQAAEVSAEEIGVTRLIPPPAPKIKSSAD